MEKNTSLASQGSPDELMKMAIDKGSDLEKLEKLLVLRERWEAGEAKKQFNMEMVAVQNRIPSVAKTLTNQQTHSVYASLDTIICQTKKIYTEQGFSISFYEGETPVPDHIRICADVVHRAGHKETYHYDVPMDGTGIKGNSNMTRIHAKASSTTYARRYLMCMIWNIPTGDDNDGNAQAEQITDEHLGKLLDILDNNPGMNKSAFCAYLKVEELDQLADKDFPKALIALQLKEKELAKKKEGAK